MATIKSVRSLSTFCVVFSFCLGFLGFTLALLGGRIGMQDYAIYLTAMVSTVNAVIGFYFLGKKRKEESQP